MKRSTAAGLGVAALAVAVLWPRRAPAVAPAAVGLGGAPGELGLRVEGERIVMPADGWGAWMQRAPVAVSEAIEAGAGGAHGVAVALLRRALPAHRWPPRRGDPGFEQWPLIVRKVAEAFDIESDPEPQRRPLQVVKE